MPTKPELEAEVEQLKSELASATPPEVAVVQAELDKIKTDLQAVSDERDAAVKDKDDALSQLAAEQDSNHKLQDQVAADGSASAALQASVTDLQAQLAAADEQVTKGSSDLGSALSKIDELQKKLDDALAAGPVAAPSADSNHVALDGVIHDIIWRSTVKDLSIEGYQKRNVDENATAIVIQKHGG